MKYIFAMALRAFLGNVLELNLKQPQLLAFVRVCILNTVFEAIDCINGYYCLRYLILFTDASLGSSKRQHNLPKLGRHNANENNCMNPFTKHHYFTNNRNSTNFNVLCIQPKLFQTIQNNINKRSIVRPTDRTNDQIELERRNVRAREGDRENLRKSQKNRIS